jgi:hypothetical protein
MASHQKLSSCTTASLNGSCVAVSLRIERALDLDDDSASWLQEAFDYRKQKDEGEVSESQQPIRPPTSDLRPQRFPHVKVIRATGPATRKRMKPMGSWPHGSRSICTRLGLARMPAW